MRNAVHTLTVPRFGGITRDLCDDDLEDRGETEIDTNFAVDWNNSVVQAPAQRKRTMPDAKFARENLDTTCAWLRLYYQERNQAHDTRRMRVVIRDQLRFAKLMRDELRSALARSV
jgi:hypothetical protein